MADNETEYERKRLQTDSDKIAISPEMLYLSADEKQIEMWDAWADELDTTRSEFVRMVANAGIKQMQLPAQGESYGDSERSYRNEILAAVEDGASDPDSVIEAVVGNVREQIRTEIDELLDTGYLDYDARQGLHVAGEEP